MMPSPAAATTEHLHLPTKAREQLAEVSAIMAARPDLAFTLTANPKQKRFLTSKKRIILYVGPNKMGKSVAAVLLALKVGVEEPGSKIWLASETFDTSRLTQQPTFYQLCPRSFVEYGTFKPQTGYTEKTVVWKNKTEFHFKSYEAGFQVMQGAQKLRLILGDEEPLERQIHEEFLMRTADHPRGQIAYTMTWLHGFTWMYHDIFMGNKPYVDIIQGEYGDNDANLPPGTSEQLKEQFAGTGMEDSRIYGRCCAVGGRPVFDISILNELLNTTHSGQSYRVAYLNGKSIVEQDPNGSVQVFVPPEEGKEYVIGVDACEGIRGKDSDKAAIWVLYKMTPCAVFWGTTPPDELADIAHALGMWYKGATIIVERNGIGGGTLATLQRNRYPRLWRDRTKKDAPCGFWHGERNWSQAMVDFATAIRQKIMTLYHRPTLLEMSTFVYNEAGKAEAQVGCHDDLVWALGLAIHGILTLHGKPVGRTPREVIVINPQATDTGNVKIQWEWD
jgi:hypothetical protein